MTIERLNPDSIAPCVECHRGDGRFVANYRVTIAGVAHLLCLHHVNELRGAMTEHVLAAKEMHHGG